MNTIHCYKEGDIITVSFSMPKVHLTAGKEYKVLFKRIKQTNMPNQVAIMNDSNDVVSLDFDYCVLLRVAGSSKIQESSKTAPLPAGVKFDKGDPVVYIDGTPIKLNGGYLVVRDCTENTMFAEECNDVLFDPSEFVKYRKMNKMYY